MTLRLNFFTLLAMAFLLSSCSWVDKGVGGNIPPRSADDEFVVNEGDTLELATYEIGVLGNDEDGGNRQLTARLVEGKGPSAAAEDGFTFNSDGTFTYIHNGDEPPSEVNVNDEIIRHCDFFTYVANDGIDDGEPKDVCIDIKAVNDIPRITAQRTISTNEDIAVTITPANLLIDDPDTLPEQLSVIIESGDNYQLEQNTVHPDSNFNGDLSVELSVSDGKATSEPFVVAINVISVNDPTVITQNVPIVMDEDTFRQITFADLEVTDPDNDYPADFTLAVNDGNYYSVDPADSTRIRPDSNHHGSLDVGITLTDKDGQVSGKTLEFQVTPVNDDPVAEGSAINVDEGGTFEAPAPGLLTADKASDVDGDPLAVDTTPVTLPQHGTLTLNTDGSWRYEHDGSETTSDSFTYRITDGNGGSDTATITIAVKPVNDIPPVVTAGQSFSVAENSADGTVVGTVAATDADSADSPVTGFAITGGNTNNAFVIDNGGQITVNTSVVLDYEAIPTFNLLVTATDGINTSAAETVVVNLSDVNDVAPVVTAGQSFSVAENSADGTVVDTVAATDADSTVTGFTITGGNTGNAFAIDSNGQITVATGTALDYETTPSFSLQVTATDGTYTSAAQTVVVNLTNNPNEATPVVTAGQGFTVAENSANGTVVDTVQATDADGNGTITGFAITGGNTGNAFAIGSNGQITVATGTALDYETTPSFSLQVTATDGTYTSAAQTVVVNLTDVNEAPIVPAGQIFNVYENLANEAVNVGPGPGGTPGPVQASDVENNALVYAIEGANPGNFIINPANGQINTSTAFDYETPPIQYTLTIKVTDNGAPVQSASQTVTININNLLDPASIDNPPVATGSCRDTIQATTLTGALQGSDAEGGVTFALGANGSAGVGPMNTTRGGSVQITNSSTGAYSYTPPAGNDKRGVTDIFRFQVTDSNSATASATETVKIGLNIMPLGDSITSGIEDVLSGTAIPVAANRKSYRQPLYAALVNSGYAVDFVGSRTDGSAASPGYDHNAEGWSGATSEQIAGSAPGPNGFTGVGDALSANPADVVLLHIGTNDMSTTDVGDIEDILNAIDNWEQANNHTVTVILAKIIDQWHRVDNHTNPQVATLNNAIAAMVAGRSNDDIVLVDMQGALAYPADLGDENHTFVYQLHPKTSGYSKMANAWRTELESGVLDKCP